MEGGRSMPHRSWSISPADHGVAGVFGTCGDARFCLPGGWRLGSIMLRGSCSARGIASSSRSAACADDSILIHMSHGALHT